MLTEQWILFRKYPNKSGDPIGAFPIWSLGNRKQGSPLDLLPTVSPHMLGTTSLFPRSTTVSDTNQRHNKKCKTPQWFSSYFHSFQLYQFRPNSIWCDNPFNFKGNKSKSSILYIFVMHTTRTYEKYCRLYVYGKLSCFFFNFFVLKCTLCSITINI